MFSQKRELDCLFAIIILGVIYDNIYNSSNNNCGCFYFNGNGWS